MGRRNYSFLPLEKHVVLDNVNVSPGNRTRIKEASGSEEGNQSDSDAKKLRSIYFVRLQPFF
jgi:hypothetical protein